MPDFIANAFSSAVEKISFTSVFYEGVSETFAVKLCTFPDVFVFQSLTFFKKFSFGKKTSF